MTRGIVTKARRYDDNGKPISVKRDNISKPIYHFGLSLQELEKRLKVLQEPDEVWITSIMTYWWESTRDVVALVKRLFPKLLYWLEVFILHLLRNMLLKILELILFLKEKFAKPANFPQTFHFILNLQAMQF